MPRCVTPDSARQRAPEKGSRSPAAMRKPHIGAELASQVKRVLLENIDLERDRKSAFEMPGTNPQ
jgi:hypothetical protein